MSRHQELNKRDRLRDEEIIRMRKAGTSLVQIGTKYAITRQRVHQLLQRLKREGRL